MPDVGDEKTPYEAVEKFYNFWFAFKCVGGALLSPALPVGTRALLQHRMLAQHVQPSGGGGWVGVRARPLHAAWREPLPLDWCEPPPPSPLKQA